MQQKDGSILLKSVPIYWRLDQDHDVERYQSTGFVDFFCCGGGGDGVHILLFSLFLVFSGLWLTSLGWSFPSSALRRTGFADRSCLNLVLAWSV